MTSKPPFPLGKCPHPPGFHKPDREAAEAKSREINYTEMLRRQAVERQYGVMEVSPGRWVRTVSGTEVTAYRK